MLESALNAKLPSKFYTLNLISCPPLSSAYSLALPRLHLSLSLTRLVSSRPGRADGRHHHGDGHGPPRATLLPSGRLRELPSSGRRQGVLRLRSPRRGDLVGSKGKKWRCEAAGWGCGGGPTLRKYQRQQCLYCFPLALPDGATTEPKAVWFLGEMRDDLDWTAPELGWNTCSLSMLGLTFFFSSSYESTSRSQPAFGLNNRTVSSGGFTLHVPRLVTRVKCTNPMLWRGFIVRAAKLGASWGWFAFFLLHPLGIIPELFVSVH